MIPGSPLAAAENVQESMRKNFKALPHLPFSPFLFFFILGPHLLPTWDFYSVSVQALDARACECVCVHAYWTQANMLGLTDEVMHKVPRCGCQRNQRWTQRARMSHAVKPEVIVLQSKYKLPPPPPVTLFGWNVCLERVISTLYQRTYAKEAQSQQFGPKTWDGHCSVTSVTEDLEDSWRLKILAVLKTCVYFNMF